MNPVEIFNKIVENLNFNSFGGPKIWVSEAYLLHTYKSSSDGFMGQFQVNLVETSKKIDENP